MLGDVELKKCLFEEKILENCIKRKQKHPKQLQINTKVE